MYDCVKEVELGLFGFVNASDEEKLKVVDGRNEERVQEAGGEGKKGDINNYLVRRGCM